MADAVGIAKAGQEVPTGYYNFGKMLEQLINKGAEIRACATCCKARGLKKEDLLKGGDIGSMADLPDGRRRVDRSSPFSQETIIAGKIVLTFGGGIGRQAAAYVLRKSLHRDHRVILVDRRCEFVFPSTY